MSIETRHLSHLALGLLTHATAGGRPGEVDDREDEEAVASIGDTGQSIVPSGECSEETEESTSLLDLDVGTVTAALQVSDTQQEEGQVQEEEEQEESDG